MDEDERILTASPQDEERGFENSLRPRRLNEFIGQGSVKANLQIAIQAALKRGEAMDHALLFGPPGLGKTTLAQIIANELGVHFRSTRRITLSLICKQIRRGIHQGEGRVRDDETSSEH